MQANKSLGQNFLKDKEIVRAIAEAAVRSPQDEVLEIGPGLGILTEALASRAARVTAIEIDARLLPVLRANLFDFSNVTIINDDFLKLDLNSLDIGENGPLRVVGNLPYYITTPILMKIIEEAVPAGSVTIMVQKEVADKIMATPSSRNYGVLSAILQYFYEIEPVADAPAECFDPRPKVDSAVINLVPISMERLASDSRFRYISLIKAAFSQRRKTLPNSLAGYLGRSKEQWAAILTDRGIDPGLRAEALSPEEFERLLV